jgi:hypothetical protein
MKRVIVALLIFTIACSAPVAQPALEAVILLPGQSSEDIHAQATDLFDRWMDANIRMPGAAFHLYRLGSSRSDAQTICAAVIPSSWGAPNAVANKAAFIVRTRQAFRAALTATNAAIVQVPASTTPTTINVLPPLDSRGIRWTFFGAGAPLHVATACDVSPSAAGVACTTGTLVQSYDAWVSRGAVVGSTFRVWLVGTDIGSALQVFEVATPDLPLADRVAVLLAARQELARILVQTPPGAGSAIAETLTAAITDLGGRRGTKRLYVLSDLRQTTPGMWAFDQRIPTPRAFVEWLESERLLPDGREIAIQVCGLHFAPTPGHAPFDARRAVELKEVWGNAFSAMHATSIAIRGECDAETFTNQEVRP